MNSWKRFQKSGAGEVAGVVVFTRRGQTTMTVAVDFGVTYVVDGNLGMHAVVKKSIFSSA